MKRRPVSNTGLQNMPAMQIASEIPQVQNIQSVNKSLPSNNSQNVNSLASTTENTAKNTKFSASKVVPFLKPKEIAQKEENQNYSYSDSYYSDYSSYSEDENSDSSLMDLVFLFQGLSMKISERNNEEEINKLEIDLQNEHKKYAQLNSELLEGQKSLEEVILQQKLFFTELFDFFANAPADLDEVEDEFLDPSGVLERLRTLRKLDPIQYKQSGLSKSVSSILSNFAEIEVLRWDFISRLPLIDMKWIRAGWFWGSEDGNSDLVPDIMDNLIPIFVDKLNSSNLSCESDFIAAYVHCLEITDYSNNYQIAETQLKGAFQRKLVDSVNRKIINKKQYESIMDSCKSYGSLKHSQV